MTNGFGIVVVDYDGRVLDYVPPLNMNLERFREAVKFGYDIYKMTLTISKELGYDKPKNMTIKTSDYEITVFNRGSRIVIVVFGQGQSIPSSVAADKAVVTA